MSPMSPRLLRPRAGGVHPEAADWRSRVIANGGTVSASTLKAVDTFCKAISSAGIRDRFVRLNLFCGGNLSAALVPLYRNTSLAGAVIGNATDTNTGPFVSGDYAETGASGGLKGNGSTKYLETGVLGSTLDKASSHLSSYVVTAETLAAFAIPLGVIRNSPQQQLSLLLNGSTVNSAASYAVDYGSGSSGSVTSSSNNPTGHLIGTRAAISEGRFFVNGVQSGSTNTNTATVDYPNTLPMFVFRRNNDVFGASYTNARLASYSIGLGLSVSQAPAFYTAMQAFQTALGRNV